MLGLIFWPHRHLNVSGFFFNNLLTFSGRPYRHLNVSRFFAGHESRHPMPNLKLRPECRRVRGSRNVTKRPPPLAVDG